MAIGTMPASARAVSAVLPLDARRPLVLPAGSVETLKWLALVLMVLDHVNTYLLGGSVPWMFAAGRTVMPIFTASAWFFTVSGSEMYWAWMFL